MKGVVDLIEMKAIVWNDETMGAEYVTEEIPAELKKKAEAFHTQLVETVAENDDEILHKFLEGEAITAEELRASLRKSTIALKLFPVVVGTAFKNKGVQPLLDAVVDYPAFAARYSGDSGRQSRHRRDRIVRKPTTRSRFPALAFKIMADPFVGQLTFIRVYSGQLKSGESVLNSRTQKTERIGRLLKMHANKREDIQEILAGDICAAVGLKNVTHRRHDLRRESIRSRSSRSRSRCRSSPSRSSRRPRPTRKRWAWRSPSWRRKIPPSRFTPIPIAARPSSAAWASLHLEIIVDRMMREYKVEANVGKPQVAYRETIRKQSEAEGKYIRQTGGRGQYGHAKIRLEPNEPGKGYEFVNEIIGGTVPEGIHQADRSGHAGSDGRRRSRRLSDGGREGHALRRQLPRRRFERNGIQDCRFDGVQGSRAQGEAGASRAGDGGRSRDAGRFCRRDHGRLEFAPRTDRRHGAPRRFAGDQGDRAAGGDVRLRDPHAFSDAGPRRVLDALRAL